MKIYRWLLKCLKRDWSRLSLRESQPNLYCSIDELPIYNWWKVNQTKDYSYLLKDKSIVCDEIILKNTWELLYREFLSTFGISESFKDYLELIRDIEILKLEKAIEQEEYLQTFIDIKEAELSEIVDQKNEDKFDKVRAYISKFMAFRIDEKVVTVKEYYGYLKLLEESAANGKKD